MAEPEEKEEKKLQPTCTTEDTGPCKLKVRVEISAEKVKEHIEDKYRELGETVVVPGFRKGQAPRKLLERKFGKALLDEAKAHLLSQSFDEVREEKKLEPVGEPEIDVEKLQVEDGKPFAYEMTLEVRPTLDIKNYTGVKVKKPAVKVEEKEVESVLKRFREAKAELVPAEDKTARLDDHIIADITFLVDDQAVETSENQELAVTPRIEFFNLPMPEYHKVLEGKKVGDTVDHPVKLPDNFILKPHAGKDAVIRTAIKSVKRRQLPELDAEFAKGFDMDSVEELQEDVRKRITREKEQDIREKMADEIIETLIKTNDFPMPEGLVKSGSEETLARMHVDMAMRGAQEDEIKQALEKEQDASREGMTKALKTHFILEHIAQAERIFVTEDQVEERITQIASQHGRMPEEMREYLEREGLLTQLRRRMREEQVRDLLLSKAVIEEEAK